MRHRVLALFVILSLAVGACSSGSDDTSSETSAPATTIAATIDATTTQAPTTTAEPSTTAVEVTAAPASAAVALPPVADDLFPLPPQPDGVPFPTDTWPVGDLPDHVDAEAVRALVQAGIDGDHGNIEGILLVHGGELVLEEYIEGFDPDAPHASFSVAKSIAHSLLGVLAAEEGLDVTAPAAIEEWAGDDRAAITPDELARMTSGLQWDELGSYTVADPPEVISMLQSQEPLIAEPGEAWVYSTGSTSINGRIMGDIVGTGDAFDDWARTVLFDPLGIGDVELQFDDAAYWFAGSGANMSARDFARLGLLWLRGGTWDGAQILPEGWMDYARTPTEAYGAYGAGFWLDWAGPDSFSAEGLNGQNVMMAPDADLVLVTVADDLNGDPIDQLAYQIIDEFRS